MNEFDLRQAIITRVQSNSKEELLEVVEGSVGHDERTLPGLGVLFEIIWQHINPQEQSRLIDALHSNLHQSGAPAQ